MGLRFFRMSFHAWILFILSKNAYHALILEASIYKQIE